ncbi:MAG: SusC/RagA family TonB-linked outer membrane protein, partial [Muribaculaceae bacterium]|nr:SusC/RagA family TonB-linked outer membrane protein [Muribaculaceae bacterium]
IDGQQRTMTHVPSQVIPANLTWETSSTINLGLDINLLNNRLNFVGDIYRKATTDMFVVGSELPAVAGYAAPYGNNADMVTKGIELSIGWQDSFHLFGKPFSYSARVSFWDSLSKITKYTAKTNTLPTIYANSYYEGMTIGEIWGYHVLGLFETDEEALEWGAVKQKKTFWSGDGGSWNAGDVKFADLDESGEVDNGSNTLENHGDLIKIGNSTPRYNYGVNLSANWNGIGVSAFFQGVGHRDWYPTAESGLFWGHYNRAYGYCLPWQVADHWTPENKDAYWPLPKSALALSNPRGALRAANDRYLQNAAYCRLKTLTVDYTFNQAWLKRTPISKLRVYVSGENLFYWSPLKKYAKNVDPEMITPGDADFQAVAGTNGQGYGYPMTKSVSVGLNVSF